MVHRATGQANSFRGYVGGGARSTVDTVDDTTLMQSFGGNMMKGESRQAVEAPQNYGFSSVCMGADKDENGKITGGAEIAVHYAGGSRSYPIGGAMDDRRHRLMGLDPGDSAQFRTKDDYQQFHMHSDGGFWSAASNKTVRMALVDQQAGQQQQGGQGGSGQSGGATVGARANGGSGGGSSGGGQGGQQQKPTGQQSVKKDNQSSKRFMHLTQDEAAASGTNVRHYLDDGNGYYEVNTDKNVYCGALKSKGQFAKVVTTKGPAKNVFGKIG
jgi:phage gp45-like